MSYYDEILRFQHRVDQRANALAVEMIKELESSKETIMGKLSSVQDKYLKKELSEETFMRKKAFFLHQRDEIQKVLGSVYSKIQDHLQEASSDVFTATAAHTIGVMNAAFGLSVSLFHLEERTVNAWFESSLVEGSTFTEWISKLKSSTADRIIKVQRQAMIQGASVGETVKMLREEGLEGSFRALSGLARTALMSAANYARVQTITQGFGDNVDGFIHLSVLDSRTCLVCASEDQKEYSLYEKLPPLPQHWNCRCCYIPKIKAPKGAEKLFAKLDQTGERATMYGPVPSKMTYSEWLRTQDSDFIRSVLGKTRSELFLEGKLSLDSMITGGRIKRLSDF